MTKRNIYLIALAMLLALGPCWGGNLHGQMSYFNEWYVPGQQYVKLRLSADGLYRVRLSDLQAAGVTNLGTIDASNLQLFYRGQEVPVHIVYDAGQFSYFDFVGYRNDGQLDTLLYRNPSNPFEHDPRQQPNIHTSLFTDTSAYFLTWAAAGNLRYDSTYSTSFAGHIPTPYFRHRVLHEFLGNEYYPGGGGSADVNHVLNPDYITGEGFVSGEVDPDADGDRLAFFMPTPAHATSGGPTRIEATVIGATSTLHIFAFDLHLIDRYRDTTSGISIGKYGFDYTQPLLPSTLFRLHAYGPNSGIIDKQRLGYVSLAYDRLFDMDGKQQVELSEWTATDTAYVKVYNADYNQQAWIFDPVGRNRIPATVIGDTLHFLIPGHPSSRKLHFFTDKAVVTPLVEAQPSLHHLGNPVAGAEFVILTHRAFTSSAQQYALYRDTTSVNPLSTKVVYIDEIYDEFGYGSPTPWAIKNFCRLALEQWNTKPRHFMIWGKGRDCIRCDPTNDFIPTFGHPANDLEYVTNMSYDTTNLVPAAGMGRVSIVSDAQGIAFLRKVDDYEHQAYSIDYKECLMMGGGKEPFEQAAIFDLNVDKMSPYITGDPMAGTVYWYQKRNGGFDSNSPLTTERHINGGLGILHYFGHSSTTVFELDLLEANRYTNYHRYPFMLVLGCSGGNYAEELQSYGERSILEPERGSIGYLGNTTSGFLQQLGYYGRDFYEHMFSDQYGGAIGDIMRSALADYCAAYEAGVNIYGANTVKQMNLQGDPSVHLKVPLQPDLRLGASDIFFPAGNPQALEAEFDMGIILHNDGRSFTDSFNISIRHVLPSGQSMVYDSIWHPSVSGMDTLILRLPNPGGLTSAGIHQFTVRLDPTDDLTEFLEDNNDANLSQLFLGNLSTPLYPPEYAIVDQATIKLQASALVMNLPSPLVYTFEIDTVASFDSPFKKTSPAIQGTAAIGEWHIGFNMQPGQVYYWRSRLTNTYPVAWATSSFKYLPGVTGWAQSQAHQMVKNQADSIAMDLVHRQWAFGSMGMEIHASISPFGFPSYFFGAHSSDNSPFPSGVFYTSIDAKRLIPNVRDTQYGDWQFSTAPSASDPSSIQPLVQMVSDMRDGDYFLLASKENPRMPYWPDAFLHVLEEVGADYHSLRAMQDGQYILFLGQKGEAPGTALQYIQPNLNLPGSSPRHDLRRILQGHYNEGRIVSTIVGPGSGWEEFRLDWHSTDGDLLGDSIKVNIYGLPSQGGEVLLMDGLQEGRSAINMLDNHHYPRLRLEAHLSDEQWYSAPQLSNWEVRHGPVPDLAIDASMALQLPGSFQEGERLETRFLLRNVSDIPSDSVWVRYRLIDSDRGVVELGRTRVPPLPPRNTQQVSFAVVTSSLGLEGGQMTLFIEVNPDEEMPELHHFNNLYYHPIQVITDSVGPLVDVLVDGRHLMSGDIISPEPQIVIQVNDDNTLLPVTVSDSTYHVWFGRERNYRLNRMLVISESDSLDSDPVRMPDNKSRLTFTPDRLQDGEYTLAVQAFDAKRNQAASEPYVIQMNVVNAKAISEVLPYPNPFSTACRFVFTLTGEAMPTRFEIEIYTITGKLVRVIDLLELGDVHVGRNISSFAWDGRDEYGDPLANGVYLYRAVTKFETGMDVGKRDEGISDFFRNGYGKLYLMR